MKTPLIALLALLFLGSAIVPFPASAHTQTVTSAGACPQTPVPHEAQPVAGDPGTYTCVHTTNPQPPAAATAADPDLANAPAATQATVANTQPAGGGGGSAGGETPAGLEQALGPFLMPVVALAYIFNMFANFLLFLVGTFFNWIFVETVLQFADNFGNSQGLLNAWGILRDVGNMFLLFGFVFIGISTILGIQNYAARKALPRFLIFAVLLNFSLFAAEVVIDTTNAISSAIYSQMEITDCGAGFTQELCTKRFGISGQIMNMSGLAAVQAPSLFIQPDRGEAQFNLWNLNTWEGAANRFLSSFSLDHQLNLIQVLLGLTIFSTILTVVLLAGAILLTIRAVVLTLIMVTAPIGFAGMVVPFLGKLAKDWWHNLINQSFFAPAYILLIFIGLTIATGTGLSGNQLVAALQEGNANTMQAVTMFALVIGFLIAALVVARKLGAYGADFAVGAASNLTFGAMSALGSTVVGRPFLRAASALRRSPAGDTAFGRFRAGLYDSIGKSSFDMRRAAGLKQALDATGVKLGDPTGPFKGGYAGLTKSLEADKLASLDAMQKARKAEWEPLDQQNTRLLAEIEIEKGRRDLGQGNPQRLAQLEEEQRAVAGRMDKTMYAQQNNLTTRHEDARKGEAQAATTLAEAEARAAAALQQFTEATQRAQRAAQERDQHFVRARAEDQAGNTAAGDSFRQLAEAAEAQRRNAEEARAQAVLDRRNAVRDRDAAAAERERFAQTVRELSQAASRMRDAAARNLERAFPFLGPADYDSNRSAATEWRRLSGRGPGQENFEKIYDAIKTLPLNLKH